MKLSIVAIGTCVVSVAAKASILEHPNSLKVVSFDLQKVLRIRPSGSLRNVSKRGHDEATLNNENFLWTVTLEIGTPPQSQRCQFDTGSSDLVVETDSSDICQSQPSVCSGRGAYDANSSSTYQYVNSKLNVAYGGGNSASGDYVLDIINVGSDVLQAVQFGVMYKSTTQECIMGVSFSAIEGSVFTYGQQYANIPIALVQEGYIQSNAYSVWLNDNEQPSGQVLFGGIDANKYYGNLVTLPFVTGPGDGTVRQCFVTLQGVQITDANGNTVALSGGSTPGPVLLDTGTTLILLPSGLAQSIYNQLGATQLGNPNNPYFVPCSMSSSTETIDFIFSGIKIHVSLYQLIYNPPASSGQYTYCELLISQSDSTTILGDTFLSSVYAVFDLDNKQAHLAPAVFDAYGDTIYEIGSGPNAVPSVMGQPLPNTSSTTSTTSATSTTTTSSSSSSSTSTTSTTSSQSSTSTASSSLSSSTSTTPSTSRSTTTSTTSTSSSRSSSTTNSRTSTTPTSSSRTTTSTTLTTSTSRTTTTTSTSHATTTTAKPTPCIQDNCYRAVVKLTYATFCSGYLKGAVQTTPSSISKGCSGAASRISSACSCLETGG